ncbi:hypothetical protein [Flavobacterium johnsoniae]|uniref:Uncharacterized protein n=1 Tax=Flavobacterium johnsoniae TaxID=986 RepID=A0A1J7BSP0_FLAJO|nr:hypothetical protein [Flavobacterium johnsoniae]OIV41723.1 hypothetical protein BKM63_14500 [Flavobacterium johnsoniae]
MEIIDNNGELRINLFHGTSSLFLDSILKYGLAGKDIIQEWRILELAQNVFSLSEKALKDSALFLKSGYSFKKMIEQDNTGLFNFQHGQTYVSPSKGSAINYSLRNTYGSELLSYTITFLRELVKEEIPNSLLTDFKHINDIMNLTPSPVLIEVSNVHSSSLLSEHGDDPQHNFNNMAGFPENLFDALTQQINFRLIKATSVENLKFWNISATGELTEISI